MTENIIKIKLWDEPNKRERVRQKVKAIIERFNSGALGFFLPEMIYSHMRHPFTNLKIYVLYIIYMSCMNYQNWKI